MVRAPRWFHDAVARERDRVAEDPQETENAARRLVERILRDETFATAIVTEYAERKLADKRARTTRPPWKDTAKRAAFVAQLDRDGMTVRAIAGYMGISVGTVHRDLTRWKAECATVATLPFKTGVHSVSATSAGADGMNTGIEHDDATVTTLRREA